MNSELLKTIEHIVRLGGSINFSKDINQLVVSVQHKDVERKSYLPLQDHVYDSKIIQHLDLIQQSFKP